MGGSKRKDYIENLMAVCRMCHMLFESKRLSEEEGREIHHNFMLNHESK
jgi:hypothetical protein